MNNGKTFVVAELSANHANNLDVVKKSIETAHEIGCDAIKIQTEKPENITIDCDNKYFRIDSGTLWDGETLFSLYSKTYLPWEWHKEIFEYGKKVGITVFSSPFDKKAVDLLEECNNPIYKIASFEITDIPLIKYIASKNKPVILSSGIATHNEIIDAISACREMGNNDITLLKCTSSYPADLSEMNILTMADMKNKYGVNVGLSDHSEGYIGAVVAVSLGAKVIEKHFTIDRSLGGPDASFSMEPNDFKEMIKQIRMAETARGNVCYELNEKTLSNRNFARSLFVTEDVKKGQIISESNVRSIRPGNGLPPKYLDTILGSCFTEDIERGTPLSFNHLESGISSKCNIKELNNKSFELRKATIDDLDLLYEWANDFVTRQNAFNTEPILYETHKEWFLNSLNNPNRYQFIMECDKTAVGQIRIDITDETGEISYSIAPLHRGNGYGSIMCRLIIEYAKENLDIKKLIARVKSNNIASKKCFINNNFSNTFEQFELVIS